MGNQKKYWKSELELSSCDNTIDHLKNNEFIDQLPTDSFLWLFLSNIINVEREASVKP